MTFGEKDYKGKLSYIEKYYKDDTLFFAAYLNNYNNFHIYIRIDYIDKLKCYKLRWFDLDFVKDSKIVKYESSEMVEEDVIDTIEKLCTVMSVDQKKNYWGKENNVGIYIDAKCKNSDEVKIKFYKYIPETQEALYQIMSIIFEIVPRKLYPFFEEIGYIFNGGADTFEYEKRFRFDLFKGDLDKVFNTVELYFEGLIDKKEALNRLRYEKPNLQVCFHSEIVLESLHFEGSELV